MFAEETDARVTDHPRHVGRAVVTAIVGAALVAFGWLIPSQFKSLPVAILAEAGRGTLDLETAVRDNLDAGRPGMASLFVAAARTVQLPAAQSLADRMADYAQANPDLAAWGEANPYLTNALENVKPAPQPGPEGGILRALLPEPARRAIADYLAGSRNATTQALLATRKLPSYHQFLPVFSAGGAPLETTILLSALLVQSGELSDPVVHELRARAEHAVESGQAAEIEGFYLDLLGLSRRYNWGQLVALVRNARSLETFARLRHLHQAAEEDAPAIAGAAALAQAPDEVTGYVMKYGPHASDAIAFALYHGKGSVDLLLRQQLPADGDLSLPPKPDASGLARSAIDPLVRFALEDPSLAIAVKFASYLLGGLLLFLAVEQITALHRLELSRPFTFATRLVGATVVCLLLVVINEPYLALGSEPAGYRLRVVVPVLGSASVDTMNTSSNAFPVDTATVLSITFFFLLQCLVYLICLLKLRDIEGRPVPNLVKLRLLENEENLFDSGLYVGIAGTSAALVLQVMGVIEANLLAAYSSNLFGILCVAFVKIRHVRVAKQRLIIKLTEPAPAPEPARVG